MAASPDGPGEDSLLRFGPETAAPLRGTKASLLAEGGVVQPGAFAITVSSPPVWPEVQPPDGDPLIESFLLNADGSVSPVGEPAAAEPWVGIATEIGTSFIDAMAGAEIDIAWPAWLTCSVTPIDQLEGQVHLDDDQIVPDAGLGLVAVYGEHVGPRAARGVAKCQTASSFAPLDVEKFDLSTTRWQRGALGELCVFAQFGQAHAGPSASEIRRVTNAPTRRLVVIRAATPGQS